MKIITSIEIRKFRSIKGITRDLELGDLNIFVGQNDNGKSNVLRALNLFFNGQTDVGQTFRFAEDYCYHATSGTGSRREVRIDLLVEPPKSRFKHAQTVRWTKKWKRDGSIIESREYAATGEAIPPKDNVSKWLDKLKYRYVPAIKGRDYFNTLMGELHDVLNEAHTKLMATQGHGFISGIQKVTHSITKELNAQIGIPSTIQVPSDFKQLFSNLDFGAKEGANTYHLKQRGDGIKVRHIPVILKYMADQEKNISIPGYVKPDTIWGFEEPENNLEMRFAFELAKTLKSYSSSIQILVTTHSPAFYALTGSGAPDIRKFFVCKDAQLCTTVTRADDTANEEMHDKMGLLPLITPYLDEVYKAQQKIKRLEHDLSKFPPTLKCCVITEDAKSENLRLVLQANGFRSNDFELFSYEGKDQIKGALILAKYLKQKHPDMEVIVHRDRDYLSDEEVSKYQSEFEKNGVSFFCTVGVDIESHFLSMAHLKHVVAHLPESALMSALDEATAGAHEDSMDRFFDHVFASTKPKNNAYSSEIKRLRTQYAANPVRYRYGKKVLGLLKANLQKITKKNQQLEAASPALIVPVLAQIAQSIKK